MLLNLFPVTNLRPDTESMHFLHIRRRYCRVSNTQHWTDSEFAWTLSLFTEIVFTITLLLGTKYKIYLFSAMYPVFTVRLHVMQRTVLLSQFCLSVCLSVRRVYCDKTKWRTANILIPRETAITLVFWHQQWLVGYVPFPLKSALKVTHPLRKTLTSTDFRS